MSARGNVGKTSATKHTGEMVDALHVRIHADMAEAATGEAPWDEPLERHVYLVLDQALSLYAAFYEGTFEVPDEPEHVH